MALDVAMHQPGTRAGDMVTEDSPGAIGRGRLGSDEAVALRGIDKVEVQGHRCSSLSGVGPREIADAVSNLPHLVAVLVNRVGRCGLGIRDEDQVNPCAVLGRDGSVVEVVEVGFEQNNRLRSVVKNRRRKDSLVERPREANAGGTHIQLECLIGDLGDGLGDKLFLLGLREVDSGVACRETVVLDVRDSRVAGGGSGIIDAVRESRGRVHDLRILN